MPKLRRSHIYIKVFLIVGLLLYLVADLYLPLPPITSEKEATDAVAYYLRHYPETVAHIANGEITTHNDDNKWIVCVFLGSGFPRYACYEVYKLTGYIVPMLAD